MKAGGRYQLSQECFRRVHSTCLVTALLSRRMELTRFCARREPHSARLWFKRICWSTNFRNGTGLILSDIYSLFMTFFGEELPTPIFLVSQIGLGRHRRSKAAMTATRITGCWLNW